MSDVLITQQIGAATDLLDKAGIAYRHNDRTRPLAQAALVAQAREVTAVICLLTDKIDAAVMDKLPNLKLIANVAVGYDNIDVQAATERGIIVTNTPDVLTETTADLAFALLLAIARRVPQSDSFMRAGRYTHFELYPEMMGVDVYGKTLGIVGMGRIGAAVARRGALGFDMPILYAGRSPNKAAEQQLNAKRVSLDELLAQSDFISLNCALTDETHHLIDDAALQKMKPTACLINTARGAVVNETDLVRALREGVIGGAALDVYEFEPKMVDGLAEIHDRLVLTPHTGSATLGTRQRMAQIAVENVVAFFGGKRPFTMLNPEVFDSQ